MQFSRLFSNKAFFNVCAKDHHSIALLKKYSSLGSIFNLEADIISKSDQSEIFSQTYNNQQYFIKRYFRTKGFASWFGFSRFRSETNNQLWFNQTNLPSAEVVAYGEERFFLKTKRAVLITKGIKHTQDLAFIASQSPEKFYNKHWRQQLIIQCASIMAFFHRNRFCHNDLHWRNILVNQDKETSQVQVYLIDCPSGKHLFWPLLDYKKLKDLANIDKFAPQHLSRTDRLRFFLAYRQINKLSDLDKDMVKDILKHKRNRVKRKSKDK